jgi:hypothetical protein
MPAPSSVSVGPSLADTRPRARNGRHQAVTAYRGGTPGLSPYKRTFGWISPAQARAPGDPVQGATAAQAS